MNGPKPLRGVRLTAVQEPSRWLLYRFPWRMRATPHCVVLAVTEKPAEQQLVLTEHRRPRHVGVTWVMNVYDLEPGRFEGESQREQVFPNTSGDRLAIGCLRGAANHSEPKRPAAYWESHVTHSPHTVRGRQHFELGDIRILAG